MPPPPKKTPPPVNDPPQSFLTEDSIAAIALADDPYAALTDRQRESVTQVAETPLLAAYTPPPEHTPVFADPTLDRERLEQRARTIPDTVPDSVRALYLGHEPLRPTHRPDADPLDVRLLALMERIFHGHLLLPDAYDAWCEVRDSIASLRERVCQTPPANSSTSGSDSGTGASTPTC